MLDKIQRYKEIQQQIENLEEAKKSLVAEVLEMMPKELACVEVPGYTVKRVKRLSVRMSVEQAESLGVAKMEKVVDRQKIKAFFDQGQSLPGVSEISYIQVYLNKKSEF